MAALGTDRGRAEKVRMTAYSTFWRDLAADSLYLENYRSPTQLFGALMAACGARFTVKLPSCREPYEAAMWMWPGSQSSISRRAIESSRGIRNESSSVWERSHWRSSHRASSSSPSSIVVSVVSG